MSKVYFTEQADPDTPAAGKVVVFPGTDKEFYIKDDAGVVSKLSGSFSPTFTVATLPAGVLGKQAVITDGDAALAWGATAVNSGAGATTYLVWYNGTNWTILGS
jgi:hypothetical protein